MKTRIAIVRDHSVSMQGIRQAAAKDYNANTASIREASIATNADTLVSVIELAHGYTAGVRTVIDQASVTALTPIPNYECNGPSTPLFDAVGLAIENLEKAGRSAGPQDAFLVIVTTDGEENSSTQWDRYLLIDKIRRLQATDKWTFVFRVPRDGRSRRRLEQFGIAPGNILEWETTAQGLDIATHQTKRGYDSYFGLRSAGVTSTQKFYADLSKVSSTEVAKKLLDISKGVLFWPVPATEAGSMIRPFVEARIGKKLKRGSAFYQLTKSEEVQEYKMIIIRDKATNAVYGGDEAKTLLGLPLNTRIRLAPSKLGNFEVFVQSTSINRKLSAGTQVLYFEAAGF